MNKVPSLFKSKQMDNKTCKTCHENKPFSDFYTYTKTHCKSCVSIQQKDAREEKKRIMSEQKQLVAIKAPKEDTFKAPKEDTFRDNETLENIVRIQGDLIRDLQKRVTMLEELLLEKSVSKLAIK